MWRISYASKDLTVASEYERNYTFDFGNIHNETQLCWISVAGKFLSGEAESRKRDFFG